MRPGFRAEHVLTFRVRPYPTVQPTSPAKMARFYERLRERLTRLPGVSAAGATTFLPLTGQGWKQARRVEESPHGADEPPPTFDIRRVTPGYFEAMGIPLLEGRAIEEDDARQELPSVVISQSVKKTYWPDASALGKRIYSARDSVGARVVGVVGDVHDTGLDAPPDQVLYYPTLGSAGGPLDLMLYVAVHTTADPGAILPEARQAVSEIDPTAPISDVRTMSKIVGDSMNRVTFTMFLLSLAAGIAVFLGAVGIYGVISYTVSGRTSEIGIRMALGADARRVALMVLLQGLGLASGAHRAGGVPARAVTPGD